MSVRQVRQKPQKYVWTYHRDPDEACYALFVVRMRGISGISRLIQPKQTREHELMRPPPLVGEGVGFGERLGGAGVGPDIRPIFGPVSLQVEDR